MNKLMLSLTLGSMLLASTSFAHSNEEAENRGAEHEEHSEASLYVVTKGLVSLSSNIDEKGSKLESDLGTGAGIDLGYRLGHGVSVEVDYAYTHVGITEKKTIGEELEKESLTGDFNSVSFDALYSYHVTEPMALFIKGGYEYETEKIKESKSEGSFIYGAGVEYEVKENLALIAEYENTTADSVKGATIAVGLVIGLNIFE